MKKIVSLTVMLFCLCAIFSCDKGEDGTHTHIKSKEYVSDQTHHWYTCQRKGCQEKVDYAPHNWNSGSVDLAPANGKDGLMTYVCKDCYSVKQEPIKYEEKKTVSENDWNIAFSKSGLKNLTATVRDSFGDGGSVVYSVQGSEAVVYVVIESYIGDELMSYLAKFQDGNYLWIMDSKDEAVEDGEFSIIGENEVMSTENLFSDYGLDFSGLYSSFVYENGKYQSTSVSGYDTVTVTFADGRVSCISATNADGEVVINVSNYGTTSPTPPSKSE